MRNDGTLPAIDFYRFIAPNSDPESDPVRQKQLQEERKEKIHQALLAFDLLKPECREVLLERIARSVEKRAECNRYKDICLWTTRLSCDEILLCHMLSLISGSNKHAGSVFMPYSSPSKFCCLNCGLPREYFLVASNPLVSDEDLRKCMQHEKVGVTRKYRTQYCSCSSIIDNTTLTDIEQYFALSAKLSKNYGAFLREFFGFEKGKNLVKFGYQLNTKFANHNPHEQKNKECRILKKEFDEILRKNGCLDEIVTRRMAARIWRYCSASASSIDYIERQSEVSERLKLSLDCVRRITNDSHWYMHNYYTHDNYLHYETIFPSEPQEGEFDKITTLTDAVLKDMQARKIDLDGSWSDFLRKAKLLMPIYLDKQKESKATTEEDIGQ